MNITLPLDSMSTHDKLQAIEDIWSDLLRRSDDIPSPSWHGDVLNAREQKVKAGTERFLTVDEAKQAVLFLIQAAV